MFNLKKVKVGDVFYSVKERNNVLRRKRISREIDGDVWFKYDMPLRTYDLVKYKILGIVEKKLHGIWPDDDLETLQKSYYIESTCDGYTKREPHFEIYEWKDGTYFSSILEANAHLRKCEEKAAADET
jgi:hypothetical protein